MAPLDLRGRAVISDGASQTLRAIRGNLEGVANSATRLQRTMNSVQTLGAQARKVGAGISGAGVAAGGAVAQIIDKTKAFNESKFGYGFARITDYIKDGRLDMAAWKKDMDGAADRAKAAAKAFGTLPSITMKAREEVEKLGFKGSESESIFGAALGLHLSEPTALASGEAAKYVGAVYRAYTKEREDLAKRMGKDAEDPEFKAAYIKGLAAKAAVAGAESALGPAEIVEGMRQFAPQWASMGISYDTALAMLAHGSNYGFRAPELGTAYKSMVTKIINPTASGLGVLNRMRIDRAAYMTNAAANPEKAAGSLNSLLHGALYAGNGGQGKKRDIREMLENAYRKGETGSPEFQESLTQETMRMLGKGWEGRIGDVREAVSNATITAKGGVDILRLINDMRAKGADVGTVAQAFEGRHVARYTPLFDHYEKLIELAAKIQKTDGSTIDAVVQGRKESEAGKTDRLSGSWEELMLALEQAGGIIDTLKTKITALNETLAGLPRGALTALTAGGIGLAGLVGGSMLLATLRGGAAALRGPGAAGAAGAGAAGATAAAGAAAGRGGGLLKWLGMGAASLLPGVGTAISLKGLLDTSKLVRAGGLKSLAWVPGIGAMAALWSLYSSGRDGVAKYQETGSVLEGVKEGSGWNALTSLLGLVFGGGQAQAATLPGAGMPAAPVVPPGASVPGIAPGGRYQLAGSELAEAQATGGASLAVGGSNPAAASEENVRASIERMRGMMASVDFSADGARAGDSFVNALSASLDRGVSVVQAAGARMQAAAGAIQLNTGPAMGGAK